jgi:hypothetical protein
MELRGWCTTAQMVRPVLARSFKDDMTLAAEKESTPEVGSSKKSTEGLLCVVYEKK